MQYESLEELIGLPEEMAVARHFTSRNYRRLRQFAGGAALVAFLALLVSLVEGDYWRMVAPVVLLALSRWIFVVGDKEFLSRSFRTILITFLIVESGLLVFLAPSMDDGMRMVAFLVTLVVPAFRLRTLDYVVLLVLLWLLALARPILDTLLDGQPFSAPRFILQTLVAGLALYLGVTTTNQDRYRFLRRFKIESSRNRERLRMRQELDSARQIQLSMLPRRDPQVTGLDIAAVSLPATEVGGDYYEYFRSEDSRFCVVVGDVAGHGVASGLMLSGVRSCLHLLHEDRPPPVEIMSKLNRMVRQTTDRRMFITLLYALLEPRAARFTVATAGHPPVLHYRAADNEVVEIGNSALPLGTQLDADYSEVVAELGAGDVLLLHTDGVSETLNQRGEIYGDDRLLDRLARVAPSKGAREIREALLSDLWNFKGDAEQLDDITIVVIRVP